MLMILIPLLVQLMRTCACVH